MPRGYPNSGPAKKKSAAAKKSPLQVHINPDVPVHSLSERDLTPIQTAVKRRVDQAVVTAEEALDKLDQGRVKLVADIGETVNHPKHYNSHPARLVCKCGAELPIECIDVIEHMDANVAMAVKHVWRLDMKWDSVEDLRKAAWYLNREVQRRIKAIKADEQRAGVAAGVSK